MIELTPADVNRILAENPAKIAKVEGDIVVARRALNTALLAKDITESKIRLGEEVKNLLQKKTLHNSDDVKAYIFMDKTYQEKALEMINAKAEMQALKVNADHLDREWVSARKHASILESERRTNTMQ